MTYWFRFEIPKNADGTRVSYSPNYHGTMPRCPRDVTVLLYNDKEGFGIAKTDDIFVPPEVTKITEAEATQILSSARDEDGIFFGEKLANRWLPEAELEDIPDVSGTLTAEAVPPRVAIDTFLKACPICHKVVAYVVKYDDRSVKVVRDGQVIIQGVIAKEIILTCPDGHKVQVVLNV